MLSMLIEKAERVVFGHRTSDTQACSPPPDTGAEFMDTVPPELPGTQAAVEADAQSQ